MGDRRRRYARGAGARRHQPRMGRRRCWHLHNQGEPATLAAGVNRLPQPCRSLILRHNRRRPRPLSTLRVGRTGPPRIGPPMTTDRRSSNGRSMAAACSATQGAPPPTTNADNVDVGTYTITVRARNVGGWSPRATSDVTVTQSPPDKPTITANGGENRASANWSADDNGSPILEWEIDGGGLFWRPQCRHRGQPPVDRRRCWHLHDQGEGPQRWRLEPMGKRRSTGPPPRRRRIQPTSKPHSALMCPPHHSASTCSAHTVRIGNAVYPILHDSGEAQSCLHEW